MLTTINEFKDRKFENINMITIDNILKKIKNPLKNGKYEFLQNEFGIPENFKNDGKIITFKIKVNNIIMPITTINNYFITELPEYYPEIKRIDNYLFVKITKP